MGCLLRVLKKVRVFTQTEVSIGERRAGPCVPPQKGWRSIHYFMGCCSFSLPERKGPKRSRPRGMAVWPFPLGLQPSRSWAHRSVLPLWHRVNKVTFLHSQAALPRLRSRAACDGNVGWFRSTFRFSRFHAANTAKNYVFSEKKAPLCKGRDALRKHAGGMFLAKAGSKLCLRPGPKGVAKRLRDCAGKVRNILKSEAKTKHFADTTPPPRLRSAPPLTQGRLSLPIKFILF